MAVGGNYFSSVKKARQALKEHAEEIYQEYRKVLKQAAAAGDFETAVKGYQHLIDHMPAEDGESLIDVSIDKKQVESRGNTGPVINIGLAIGGVKRGELPPAEDVVIDLTEISSDDSEK